VKIIFLVLGLMLAARTTDAQSNGGVGCQARIEVMNSWVNPSEGPWSATVTYGPGYFGPGYLFDYPAGASRVTLVSFSGHVMRFTASGEPKPNGAFAYTQAGLTLFDPEVVQFYGYYWRQAPKTWTVSRDFGPNASADLNFQLMPFDQWWSAASNAYTSPVWVRWILHVVVC